MFHHHRKKILDPPIMHSRVETVRLLQSREELQTAVERARAFERRGAYEYGRRIGSYDRLLSDDDDLADVVPIESSAQPS